MGLFNKFRKKSCKEELLVKVSELYNRATTLMQIQKGEIEEPEDWEEQEISVYSVYVEIAMDVSPLIENIFDCEDFPEMESGYWAGHLNAFAANLLYKSRRINDSVQYYEAAINVFKDLEKEYPDFQYYQESQIVTDIYNYTADIMMHLAQVRRLYVAMLTQSGKEKLAEEVIIENIEYGEKKFVEIPDTFLSFADDLEQAAVFYTDADAQKSLSFYKKAIEIVESRADLKTHMDNNDPRLFRIKFLYMGGLLNNQDNQFEELASKIQEELSPYYDFTENVEEMTPLLQTPLDEHIIAKGNIDILISRIRVAHETYNSISSEPSEEKQLELFNWCCNEFSELTDDGVWNKLVMPDELLIEKEEGVFYILIKYLALHCQAFLGYIYNRANRELEVAEKLLLQTAKEFLELEKKGESGYLTIVPWTIISYFDEIYFNSSKVYQLYAGNLSEQDKKKEAGDAFLKCINIARKAYMSFNNNEEDKTDLSNVPAGAKPFENLAHILNIAGEFFRFPQEGVNSQEMAVEFFKEAAELLEENIADLETFMENGDIRLLKYKDNYAFLLRLLDREKEQEQIEREIEPYKEYITWRFESNYLEQ